jgi:hypothetical protein
VIRGVITWNILFPFEMYLHEDTVRDVSNTGTRIYLLLDGLLYRLHIDQVVIVIHGIENYVSIQILGYVRLNHVYGHNQNVKSN